MDNVFPAKIPAACVHDSDGDGNCHLCRESGSCHHTTVLSIANLMCLIGYELGTDHAVNNHTTMREFQERLKAIQAPEWAHKLLHEVNAEAPSHAMPLKAFRDHVYNKLAEAAKQKPDAETMTFMGIDFADPLSPSVSVYSCPTCSERFEANSPEFVEHIQNEHTVGQYSRAYFLNPEHDLEKLTPRQIKDLLIIAGVPASRVEKLQL